MHKNTHLHAHYYQGDKEVEIEINRNSRLSNFFYTMRYLKVTRLTGDFNLDKNGMVTDIEIRGCHKNEFMHKMYTEATHYGYMGKIEPFEYVSKYDGKTYRSIQFDLSLEK